MLLTGLTSSTDDGLAIGLEPAAAIRELAQRDRHAGEDVIGRYWELGRLVEERVEKPERLASGGNPGRPSSKNLAQLLGVEVSRLKAARMIYKAFPSLKAKEQLTAMRRADGQPLQVWTVARLCSPTLLEDRLALLEKACRENWSCSDARDKLKASRGVDALVRTGGRKHRPPRSLPIALARWQREADDLIRHNAAVFRPDVIAKLLESPEATSVTVERVLDVRRTVERTLTAIVVELQMLDRIAAGLPGPVSAITPSGPPPVSEPKLDPDGPKPGRGGRRP